MEGYQDHTYFHGLQYKMFYGYNWGQKSFNAIETVLRSPVFEDHLCQQTTFQTP